MMRRWFILILLMNLNTQAQTNLVPNGDFEENTNCPGSFNVVKNWMPCGSPDYFNVCNTNSFGIPDNIIGYQNAQSGQAYIGLGIYKEGLNLREYAKVKLKSKCKDTCNYYFVLYYSIAEKAKYLSKTFQVLISTYDHTCNINNHTQIFDFPQIINYDAQFADTNLVDWNKLEIVLKFTNNAEWLYIGNFFNNDSTIAILNPDGISIHDYAYI